MKPHWRIPPTDPAAIAAMSRNFGIHGIIASILHSRGFTSADEIRSFIDPRLSQLHSPFLMAGMSDAVNRIKKAVDDREHIGIFSDSDLDGITSLVMIISLLTKMNIQVSYRHLKNDEQYGLTAGIIDEFKKKGATLLITVDSGIRDVDEINYARSIGMDVIVTDHHEQDTVLPDAIIINPKAFHCTYPFKDLAGVGVVFKLCIALLMSYQPSFNRQFIAIMQDDDAWALHRVRNGIIEGSEKQLTLTEISRMIDGSDPDDILIECNGGVIEDEIMKKHKGRVIFNIVRYAQTIDKAHSSGIEAIWLDISNKNNIHCEKSGVISRLLLELQLRGSGKIMEFIRDFIGLVSIGTIADVMPLVGENRVLVRLGLDALKDTRHQGLAMLLNGSISSKAVGWVLAPLLNTPGRLGKASLTVDFFIEKEKGRLKEIISEIKAMNQDRKAQVREICEGIIDSLGKPEKTDKSMILVESDQVPEGIAGLIANRISDTMEKPVIVVSLPGSGGVVKGSGRCTGGINFFSHVEPFIDEFERIGGHNQAFGFTIRRDRIGRVMESIEKSIQNAETAKPQLTIDCEIPLGSITNSLFRDLQILEPCAKGNEEPVFITRDLVISSFSSFGNEKHGRIMFNGQNTLTAIGWGMADLMRSYAKSERSVDVVYKLEMNDYRGRSEPRMIIIDIDNSEN